jgi:Cu/Ag efflux pump CusA
MVGGMVSATLLTLAVVPAAFFIWQLFRVRRSTREMHENSAT